MCTISYGLIIFLTYILSFVGVYAHFGISQFGEIFTHSCTAFRISRFEIKNGRVLYGVDLVHRNNYINSPM